MAKFKIYTSRSLRKRIKKTEEELKEHNRTYNGRWINLHKKQFFQKQFILKAKIEALKDLL